MNILNFDTFRDERKATYGRILQDRVKDLLADFLHALPNGSDTPDVDRHLLALYFKAPSDDTVVHLFRLKQAVLAGQPHLQRSTPAVSALFHSDTLIGTKPYRARTQSYNRPQIKPSSQPGSSECTT